MTPRDGKENQEINDIPMIEKRTQNDDPKEPNEVETRVCVETESTDEDHLIIDELKALMIRNETEEYLTFQESRSNEIERCNYESECSDKDVLKQMI